MYHHFEIQTPFPVTELNVPFEELYTYPLGHIVVGSSIHVSGGPLEEALLADGRYLPVSSVIKLSFSLTEVGVIKVRSGLTLARAHF